MFACYDVTTSLDNGQHISSVHRSSAHRPRSIGLLVCSHSRLRLALHKNCQKRRCAVPRRMVSLSVRNVWLSLFACYQTVHRLSSIGDWYPERNIFQILIALTSGTCSDFCSVRSTLHSFQVPASRLCFCSTSSTTLPLPPFQLLYSYSALYARCPAEAGFTSRLAMTTMFTTL